ncbi:acyltransferase [Novosphingobium flavum]|uniref:Acyltransferase n=1 Tax=Novosphingobium flavum TaxID=1778672 RepID=A0A7X1KJW8_9SPHN|nr:acyltransferase [Novosphingobium flavum]MBC2663914.1 acyltransferase [Novosphingobium flavum]
MLPSSALPSAPACADAAAPPGPARDAGGRAHFAVLDAWRGVAALAVAFRHINGTAFFLNGPLHSALSSAVDFFFILSGFVIAASYGERLARGFSLLRYAVLRWGRVWPLHGLMVLAYVLFETALWLRGSGGLLGGREAFTGPRDPATLLPSLMLVQAWIWPGRDLWNTQSWSVSVEMALYCGSALLWRVLGLRANWLALPAGLAALWAIALFPAGEQLLRGVAGFGFGMACWAVWPRLSALALPRPALQVAEPLLVGAALLAFATDQSLRLIDPLFVLVLLVFARAEGPISALLKTAPARWLGALSYSLYMVHMLVIGRLCDALAFVQARIGARWISVHLGGRDVILLDPLPAFGVVVAMLAVTLVAAWAAYALVEWPARDWSRRLAGRIGPQPA